MKTLEDVSSGEISRGRMQDAKGGKTPSGRFSMSKNFLATDEVPETIFGIPVVSREEDYTEKDIAFFREHPEAGGYYDLGDEEAPVEEAPVEEAPVEEAPVEEAPVEEAPVEEAPMQAAGKGGDTRGEYPGISNNPGNVEKYERRTDHTLFHGEIEGGVRPARFANFDNPTNGLNAAGIVIVRRGRDLRNAGRPFTIENYAPRYAPPTENDTEKYIRNLSKYSGIARDAVLDPLDNASMSKLLKTVVRFESGYPHSEWFTDNEYTTAAKMMADEERVNPVVEKPAKKTAAPSPSAKKRITTAPRGSTRSKAGSTHE